MRAEPITLSEIDPATWERLTAGRSFYVSQPWLTSCEPHEGTEPCHLAIRDGRGGVLGVLPLYNYEGQRSPAYNYQARFGFSPPSGRPWPILLAGGRAGYDGDVLVDSTLPVPGATAVRRRLLEAAIERCGHDDAAALTFSYIREALAAHLLDELPEQVPLLAAADTVIDVDFADFQGYLASLGSKRARKLQREIEDFGRSGASIELLDLRSIYEQLGPMLAQTQHRHGQPASADRSTRLLERQSQCFGDHCIVFGCRRSGRLIGFGMFVEWGDALYGRCVGFDYERTQQRGFEYFNITYYAPMRYALARGLSQIRLGIESYAAKTARGARPEPLWTLVAHADPRDRSAWRRHVLGIGRQQFDAIRGELAHGAELRTDLHAARV